MPQVEFWFEFASTYSHIAAQTVAERARSTGVHLLWRPFLLGPLFGRQGLIDSPFNLNPVKGAYMWRDVARECSRLGLQFRKPSVFPRNGLLAARIATAGDGLPWQPAFVRQVYIANFATDQDISDTNVLKCSLKQADVPDPEAVLALAGDPSVKNRLRDRTELAWRSGIFGAPAFRVGEEIFWGADRMDQALAWAVRPETDWSLKS